MTPFRLPMPLQVGCDLYMAVTVLGLNQAQLGFLAATATLEARITPGDGVAPLFAVSTTSDTSGGLQFGVTFPPPAGIAAMGAAALEQLAPGSTVLATLPPPLVSVVDLSDLEAFGTAGVVIGAIAFVEELGDYFAWSPGDPSTPNGTTIILGNGTPPSVAGNWLLAGTIIIRVTAAATAAFAGIQVGTFDLLVTCADGTVVNLLTGPVEPVQTSVWTGDSLPPSPPFSGNATELQGVPIATTTPIQSAVPVFDGTSYSIRPLTLDDILPGFSIESFSGGSTVEVGATVTNPAFTASYSATPASATITNTDGTDSPLVLSTPFTSGTVVGTFHKTAPASVTFTLTAVGASTKTASQSINFFERVFAGAGTAGATSATASGSSAVLVAASGTLASEGLFSGIVGDTFGPVSPSSQKVYVLTPHTSSPHTFRDQNGFAFAMNAPTTFSFTNQNGAVLSMDLYESTNVLSSPFTLTVLT
jgi:hypothetical protein